MHHVSQWFRQNGLTRLDQVKCELDPMLRRHMVRRNTEAEVNIVNEVRKACVIDEAKVADMVAVFGYSEIKVSKSGESANYSV